MARVRRGVFICVGWQVTPCDPIWQVTSRSYEMEFPQEGQLPFSGESLGRQTCDQQVVSSTPGHALLGEYLDG